MGDGLLYSCVHKRKQMGGVDKQMFNRGAKAALRVMASGDPDIVVLLMMTIVRARSNATSHEQ
jgi:hypothetical protein